jgi:hypothetical protein
MSQENTSKTDRLKKHLKKNWAKYLLGATAAYNLSSAISSGLLWKTALDNKNKIDSITKSNKQA